METNTAKEIAAKRHDLMLDFLDAFKQEWDLDFSKIEK
jgi:HD superfamily phosphodiesterase